MRAHADLDLSPRSEWQAALPYVAPILIFGVLTSVEASVAPDWFVTVYAVKILLVVAALVLLSEPLREVRWQSAAVPASMLVGLLVFGIWIGVEEWLAYPHLGERTAFNPAVIETAPSRWTFLMLRFTGLVLVVPVMEELFWRSFILRYLTSGGFPLPPVGTFSVSALLIMTVGSAVSHPEWLVAAITSVLYAAWIRRTRSIAAVIVAHATTNAALGAYVVATGRWTYW